MTDTSNVAALMKAQAASRPDQAALVFPDGRDGPGPRWASMTYAELDARSDRYARGFLDKGIRRGDRTLFLVKPSLEFYAIVLGLLKIGAVPVVVDPGMGIRNVLACIAQIRPRAVVAIPLVHVIRVFARKAFASAEVLITHGRRWFWGGHTTAACLAPEGASFDMPAFSADDEAFIVFTSGSTGVPKGVSFRHGMFLAATHKLEARCGLGPGRISIETFAPFVLFHLALGETTVIPDMDMSKPMKADPAKVVEAFEAFKPQVAFASPAVLRKVMGYCQARGKVLEGVERVLTGVAPIPGEFHRAFRDILPPGGTISVNYGATEALTLTSIESAEVLDETWPLTAKGHGNCVGRPYPGADLRIIRITDEPIDRWSDDLLLPQGEIGEIVAGGAVVSPEYKDHPEGNAKAKIREGDRVLHRMGDLGYFDEQGRLWFCGRKAHRIQTADGMIPNVPVEGVFNEHPAVLRTALVGAEVQGGALPVLCVELREGHAWSDALADEILALAADTRWAEVVCMALHHTGFPMDARHNSKIRNEDLAVWAAGQLRVRQVPGPKEDAA